MFRDLPFYFLAILIAGLLLGFAWMTQNPSSPWIEEAEDWPVVGGLAQRFRVAYLGPAAKKDQERKGPSALAGGLSAPGSAAAGGDPRTKNQGGAQPSAKVETTDGGVRTIELSPGELPEGPLDLTHLSEAPGGRLPARPDAGGEPATGDLRIKDVQVKNTQAPPTQPGSAQEIIANLPPTPGRMAFDFGGASRPRIAFLALDRAWLMPGNSLRANPSASAEALHQFHALAYLPVIAEEGNWRQVVYRGQKGWVDRDWKPSLKRKGARQGIVRHKTQPDQSSNWRRLRAAKKILGIKKPKRKLGGYQLFSDVEDEALLEFLEGAAVAAEEAYFARFGRLPSGNPYRSVILFANEADYREFSDGSNLSSSSHAGHATIGLLAFYAEGRPREDLASTLVHEITHLMNDRALSWILPPWLEEGTASDVGSLWVETSADEVDTARPEGASNFAFAPADLKLIFLGDLAGSGQLPAAELLFRLDYLTFHRPGVQFWAYAHSAALVAYLLDGDGGRHALAFREFLKRIAGGRGADPELLFRLLEMDSDTLDTGFRAWLAVESKAARARFEGDALRSLS